MLLKHALVNGNRNQEFGQDHLLLELMARRQRKTSLRYVTDAVQIRCGDHAACLHVPQIGSTEEHCHGEHFQGAPTVKDGQFGACLIGTIINLGLDMLALKEGAMSRGTNVSSVAVRNNLNPILMGMQCPPCWPVWLTSILA